MRDTKKPDKPGAEESPTYFPPAGTQHVVLPLHPDEQRLADRAKELLFDAELASLVIEHLPDAIVIVDDQGIIRRTNAKAELLFGYPRSEMIGQVIDLLVPEKQREMHLAHRLTYMEDPHTRRMGTGLDLKAKRRNGTEVLVDINLAPVVTTRGVWVIATVRHKS